MLIAQISDFHILGSGLLYGGQVPSNAMAQAAVAQVNSLLPRPDLVLVSGDITDDGRDESYALARAILDGLAMPYRVLPGNHDERRAFRRAFADRLALPPGDEALHQSFDAGPLRLVALDSTVPSQHHGAIDAAGLAWLGDVLDEDDRPVLLALHHHPFASGIGFLDAYALRDAVALERVVAERGNVQAVLCGHVHRFMARRFGGTLALSCPSTASQIALRLAPGAEPASFREPPGYLLHDWRPESSLVSHLVPIGDFGPPIGFF